MKHFSRELHYSFSIHPIYLPQPLFWAKRETQIFLNLNKRTITFSPRYSKLNLPIISIFSRREHTIKIPHCFYIPEGFNPRDGLTYHYVYYVRSFSIWPRWTCCCRRDGKTESSSKRGIFGAREREDNGAKWQPAACLRSDFDTSEWLTFGLSAVAANKRYSPRSEGRPARTAITALVKPLPRGGGDSSAVSCPRQAWQMR